jgi:Type IIA topoisomerase (DNA gyrase/topo II, topoisomerase IV), A subunit
MADDKNPQLPLTPPPGDGNPPGPGALNIVPVNVEEEMRRSYLDYSMSVIIGRASPIFATDSSPCIAAFFTR